MHGKVHDYLSMMIDYSIPGKFIIHMDDYAKGILDEAPADMDGVVLTLVAEHLFDVNKDAGSVAGSHAGRAVPPPYG